MFKSKEIKLLICLHVKFSPFLVYWRFSKWHNFIIYLSNLCNKQIEHHNLNQINIKQPESPRNVSDKLKFWEFIIFLWIRIINPIIIFNVFKISNWYSHSLNKHSCKWVHSRIGISCILNFIWQNILKQWEGTYETNKHTKKRKKFFHNLKKHLNKLSEFFLKSNVLK